MNIRDSVKSSENKVSKESYELSQFVRDTSHSLIDRLESFEDITSFEVGDTSFVRSRALEREYNVRQIYLKLEGDNPSGTQKDRIAFAQVYDAIRRGFDEICLATCGNYGVAVALASSLAGIRCHVFIPEDYHTDRIQELVDLSALLHRLPGSYEEVVKASSQLAVENEWYDANPGGENTPIQLAAYSQIATEIYEQLRDAPHICAVPVSNGTLLAGIFRGFVSLYKRGKTSRIPRMLAASSTMKNPIIQSFHRGINYCEDLDPVKIRETKLNEPLINWHSFDGEEALYALRESDGIAYNISDKSMRDMAAFLSKKESFRVLPASTAGLIGLLKWNENQPLEHERYVSVITAKN